MYIWMNWMVKVFCSSESVTRMKELVLSNGSHICGKTFQHVRGNDVTSLINKKSLCEDFWKFWQVEVQDCSDL